MSAVNEEKKKERQEAALKDAKKFVDKADAVVGTKVRSGFKWLKRISGIIFLLISIPILLSEVYVIGFIFAGIAVLLLAGGFGNLFIQKIAFSMIFAGFGVGFIIYGYNVLQNAKQSEKWPVVNGTVFLSKIEKHENTTGKGVKRRTTVSYLPKIEYKYSINGREYKSNNVVFGQSTEGAGNIVQRYPKGKKVKVYYNPSDHATAVLEPGVGISSYLFIGFGILFSIISTVFIKQTITQMKQ
ncbi:MAG: DUF3592 domain-containing protein [Spirochaetota bacterium]|nr:DUF3592 domain-containing protein [Spirochaetota bacterium]